MPNLAALDDISAYHTDTEASLRNYYSPSHGGYQTRFTGYFPSEVSDELAARVDETEMRSVLVILARVEAAFRQDYKARITGKSSDSISTAFRRLHKAKGVKVRLEDDILSIWQYHVEPTERKNIGDLKGMLKYRHWLAHGRYWNLGRQHSYQDVYLLADIILFSLPLYH